MAYPLNDGEIVYEAARRLSAAYTKHVFIAHDRIGNRRRVAP